MFINVYVYLFEFSPNLTWNIKTGHLSELPLKIYEIVKD